MENGHYMFKICIICIHSYSNMSCVFVQLVAQLIHPAVNPNEVMQFLWQHMRSDVDTIHTAVGCSLDDVLVLVHLLLRQALETGGLGGLLSFFDM